MTPRAIRELLARVARAETTPEDAFEQLRNLPFAEIDVARVDTHRQLRSGFPEIIYGECKSADEIASIGREILAAGQNLFITRLDADKAEAVQAQIGQLRYDRQSRTAQLKTEAQAETAGGKVAVVSAGTADAPVAAEATATLSFLDIPVVTLRDVGVAGIHRLLASRNRLEEAQVAIVVAGMEGALPSVVGGMAGLPIIAVPTSVGYGASFGGLAALLAMLNSCAAGVTVVNIDNGFGAAIAAAMIVRSSSEVR